MGMIPGLRPGSSITPEQRIALGWDRGSACPCFRRETATGIAPVVCPHAWKNHARKRQGAWGQTESKYRPWYRFQRHRDRYLLWDSAPPDPAAENCFPHTAGNQFSL